MLILPSSADRRWPWTDADLEKAEAIFAAAYPSVYRHLKQHETRLRARSDQGVYWWELRTCSYYSVFEPPKIVMQRFAYHSRFGLDMAGRFINDSAILLPTDDRWLLGCLNSPAFWYYAFRTLPHKKDEALGVDIDKVKDLPIPPGDRYRAEVAPAVERLIEITRERADATRALLDWLRVEMRVITPGRALNSPHRMTSNDFVNEVKKRRPRTYGLSSADLRRLRTEYDLVVPPLVEAWNQALGLERKVADAVHSAYGLSTTDVALMWDTAPPRMPGTGGDEEEEAEDTA